MLEFDLADLEDSVFEIHEEVFSDECQLFRLDSHFDSVMRSNLRAKMDGVFRGRLSADLRKRTNWEEFWRESDNRRKVTAQFLMAPDNSAARYSMDYVAKQSPVSCGAFLKSLKNPQTLENPSPTCCSEVLQRDGPKRAVKHFYETLMSKAVVIPKWSRLEQGENLGHKKMKFSDRQSLIQGQDPELVCTLLEQSMTSNLYQVDDSKTVSHEKEQCQCHNCHLHRHVQDLARCKVENLKENGEGDNCSLYLTDFEEDCNKYLYITRSFALSHLCHLNMLTDLDSYYSGVSFPFVYVGGLHSFFAMHIEDMSLPSLNYLHMGHPKLWIVVAPFEVTRLSIILSNYGLHNVHRVCVFKLTHKTSVVFPQLLVHHDIKFKIIIQEPGDFIFLAPNAAHTGGNMGVNLAEACNIGTLDWLPYGSVASTQNCSCLEEKVHMDVTPLFKMHRKDLLKYHESGTMIENYNDVHFKRSIIAVHPVESGQEALPMPIPRLHTSAKNTMKVERKRASCPVKGCMRTYQIPVKREMLLSHIQQEHPTHVTDMKTTEDVDRLCSTKSRGGQRYKCSDCGAQISVNSNRHKGSEACKRRSAIVQTVP